MTLIVSYQSEIGCWLLGDGLLTVDSKVHVDSPIPTTLLPNEELFDQKFSIVELAQKVLILDPRCAIAWCGLASEAWPWIKSFRAWLAAPRNIDQINRYLDDHPTFEFAYVISFIDTGPVAQSGWSITTINTPDAISTRLPPRIMVVNGSAAVPFIRKFTCDVEMTNPKTTAHDVLASLLSNAHDILLHQERRPASGYLHRAGGFFEIVEVVDGQFRYIDNILYLHLEAEVHPDRTNAEIVGNVYRTSHNSAGASIISRSAFGENNKLWIVEPPWGASHDNAMEIAKSFSTEVVVISLRDRLTGVPVYIVARRPSRLPVTIEDEGDHYSFNFDWELIHQAASAAVAGYPKRADGS